MKRNITQALTEEHRLILRMTALLKHNASLTAKGRYRNWRFYIDCVDFIRAYADRFHHAKEEDILFEALIKNGMPRENSPVAAMLMEHDRGRACVAALDAAAREALAGEPDRESAIAENALAYVELLREHIGKEDDILYPLAERVIPDSMREGIINAYAAAEAHAPAGFRDRYEIMVAGYEQELLLGRG